MITILVIITLVLGLIAINTVGKLSNILHEITGTQPGETNETENKYNAVGILLFFILFLASVVWQIYAWGDKILPESASVHGFEIDKLLNWTWLVISVPFVLCHIALLWFCYKYAFHTNNKATFFPHSNKLELIWTIIPTIVLSILIIYGLKTWTNIMTPAKADAIKIELYAKQFDWTARYAGNDNQYGRANVKLIAGVNALGVDSLDSRSWDDKITKEIHLPVGKQIDFQFRSQDVIHSAYMPHFRAQMNCVPGMITQFNFVPSKTTQDMRKDPKVIARYKVINEVRAAKGDSPVEFDYVLICNKICGAAHYNMKLKIVVDTQEDYNKWIAAQQPFYTEMIK